MQNSCLLSSLVPPVRNALARPGKSRVSCCHARIRLDSSCVRSHLTYARDQVWHRNDQVVEEDNERQKRSGEVEDVVDDASWVKVE